MAELDAAVRDLVSLVASDPSRWTRGRPGRWTAGEHTAHLLIALTATADAFERSLQRALDGSLPPVPRRGPVQWLWVTYLVKRGTMPRGVRTPPRFEPGAGPDRAQTLERLGREVERHRALGARLTPAQRDLLWVRNPFLPRWHYRLPEMVRVHTVHVRHHLKLMAEIG